MPDGARASKSSHLDLECLNLRVLLRLSTEFALVYKAHRSVQGMSKKGQRKDRPQSRAEGHGPSWPACDRSKPT